MQIRTLTLTLIMLLTLALVCCGCGDDDDPSCPVTTGTIVINTMPDNLNAPWTLTGDAEFSETGNGDRTLGHLDPGDYLLTWGEVAGWVAPDPEANALAADTTIVFEGVYEPSDFTVTFVTEIGSQGSGQGQFDGVGDTALDPDGHLYVCDYGNDRVQKFDNNGAFLLEFGHTRAEDIETDEFGNVYVWGNWMLHKYDGNGARINSFHMINTSTSSGSPCRFAVSRQTDELAILNLCGPLVDVWNPGENDYTFYEINSSKILRARKSDCGHMSIFGEDGEGPGQFLKPYAAEYDAAGRLFIMDPDRDNTQIFSGELFVSTAPAPTSMSNFTGFCVDDDGRLYYGNGFTVQVFSADGARVETISVDYESGSPVYTSHIQTRNEPGTGAVLLFVSSHYSVLVYRLTFVGW